MMNVASSNKKVRGFPFTINNYSQEELEILKAYDDADIRNEYNIVYIIFAEEVGAEGTPHIQGFVYFTNPRTLGGAHRVPGFRRAAMFHMSQFATVEQNVNYVKKTNQPEGVMPNERVYEYGEKPSQGKRTDLAGAIELFQKAKYDLNRVATEAPEIFIKHFRGFQALKTYSESRERDFKTKIVWCYGATGTGKSKAVFEWKQFTKLFYKDTHSSWWDGYTNQDVCVLDDYRCDMCTFSTLLQLFDRYPMSVPVKGGYIQILFKVIFVTAPYPPSEMWKSRTEEQLAQLERRIEHVFRFPLNGLEKQMWEALTVEMKSSMNTFLTMEETAGAEPMNIVDGA